MLPDEAAVRISNRHGTLFDILYQLAGTWPVCVGESDPPDSVGHAMIEVINEPDASLYNMLVGFYRQAIDSLRIILDAVCVGAYCHLTTQATVLQDWLEGNDEVKFNIVATGLSRAPETKQLHDYLVQTVYFGFVDQANRARAYPGGWMRQLYQNLSKYSHGWPLYNNIGLWQRNGPIYVGCSVAIVTGLFIETFVASYIIVKLCRPDFELPAEALEVFDTDALHLPDWVQVSEAARRRISLFLADHSTSACADLVFLPFRCSAHTPLLREREFTAKFDTILKAKSVISAYSPNNKQRKLRRRH